MQTWNVIAATLAGIGSLFIFLASLGALRMPDLYTYAGGHKASAFGAVCCLLAVGFHFREIDILFRVILVCSFLVLTAPVAAHALCRAGIICRIPMCKDSQVNDLEDQFSVSTKKQLDSADC